MSDLQTLVSPADAGPPAEDQPVRIDAIQQRVHELASKAQSFLGRPTNANYKQALALYERIRGTGRVAAAELTGNQCGACRVELDRVAFNAARAAAPDVVVRCENCGAILIRN